MFSKYNILIQLYRNEAEIINLDNEKRIRKKSPQDFSSNRLLVGDFMIAEAFLRGLMKELLFEGKTKLFASQARILFQAMEMYEGGLSHVELRVLQDLGDRLGSSETLVIDGSTPISNEKALRMLREM